MRIELINTGTELMLGRVLNSHQQWLCRELANLGYVVSRQVAVDDSGPAIQQAVGDALSRSDLIITTGGLGPTSDDITRDLIAELLGKKLEFDSNVMACIENFFAQRKRRVPENARKQAMVPKGAIVLPNHFGTAPGLVMEVGSSRCDDSGRVQRAARQGSAPERRGDIATRCPYLIMLPGPPRELRPMFTNEVVPLLKKCLPLKETFVCRTLRTTGIGESFVEEKIDKPLQQLISAGLELGYCARVGEVEVRLAARGKQAKKIVAEAEKIVRAELGKHVFGIDDKTLEEVAVRELTKQKQTLALAESCTGGLIANRITNVSGSSAVLMAGLVTYSNESKQRLLGVREETLKKRGAVSEETAREMAEGARQRNKVDYALAVTGIAGPTGGTKEKPVGTVFIALATPKRTIVLKNFNQYDRETFKFLTSQQSLDLLRREL